MTSMTCRPPGRKWPRFGLRTSRWSGRRANTRESFRRTWRTSRFATRWSAVAGRARRQPAANNTIIVFWSDNGFHLGEKQHLQSSRFGIGPRVCRSLWLPPGVTREQSRTERPVSFVDLFPTLNELCDLPLAPGLDGVSLVPLLKDPQRKWEQPALTTHGLGNHALRDERWRYIRYADGGEELYDHENDPNE